jgi:phosphatidylethanolamine N-methyltransferase
MDTLGARFLQLEKEALIVLRAYALAFERWTVFVRKPLEVVAQRLAQQSAYLDLASARAITYIIAAPLLWNVLARLEYYTSVWSRLCRGRRRFACLLLACWVFSFSLYRDLVVLEAMQTSAVRLPPFPQAFIPAVVWRFCTPRTIASAVDAVAWAAFATGLVLVTTSFLQLGLFGTYLGDYFGILKPSKVSGFPFSHFEHPMYDGSSLLFLAEALFERSTLGLLLTLLLFAMYRIATIWEGSFTNYIYANRARQRATFFGRKHAD